MRRILPRQNKVDAGVDDVALNVGQELLLGRGEDEPTRTNQMPTEPLFNLTALQATLQKFADERNWNQYHSPKNLAMALTAEVGELVEIFQWLSEDQSKSVATDEKLGAAVRDELADVFIYLVRLGQVLGVDLDEAVREKIEKNARKYPPEVLGHRAN